MKSYFLHIIALVLLCSASSFAQQIGDDALQRAQNGEVTFLEGEFVAFLSDTISPGFVKQQFGLLGYELSSIDIPTLRISLVNTPPDSTLKRLSAHPSVLSYLNYSADPDSASLRGKIEAQGLEDEMLNAALEKLMSAGPENEILIEFDYDITEQKLKKLMGEFRNVAYHILTVPVKTVNISVEPGTEAEAMEKVEQLPFVESTAMIGVLSDN